MPEFTPESKDAADRPIFVYATGCDCAGELSFSVGHGAPGPEVHLRDTQPAEPDRHRSSGADPGADAARFRPEGSRTHLPRNRRDRDRSQIGTPADHTGVGSTIRRRVDR
jgi:hypothetical protein